jgi:hypothetical protein
MTDSIHNREDFTPTECINYQIQANLRSKARYENSICILKERAANTLTRLITLIGIQNVYTLKDLYSIKHENSIKILDISSEITGMKTQMLKFNRFQKERKDLYNLTKVKEVELNEYKKNIEKAKKDIELILSQIKKLSDTKLINLLESFVKDEYNIQEYNNEIQLINTYIENIRVIE